MDCKPGDDAGELHPLGRDLFASPFGTNAMKANIYEVDEAESIARPILRGSARKSLVCNWK
jgi:hypothetical protein